MRFESDTLDFDSPMETLENIQDAILWDIHDRLSEWALQHSDRLSIKCHRRSVLVSVSMYGPHYNNRFINLHCVIFFGDDPGNLIVSCIGYNNVDGRHHGRINQEKIFNLVDIDCYDKIMRRVASLIE